MRNDMQKEICLSTKSKSWIWSHLFPDLTRAPHGAESLDVKAHVLQH